MKLIAVVGVVMLAAGCGGDSLPHTNDTDKPTQVVGLPGGLELQLDHTAGDIFTINHNGRAIGLVVVDASDTSRRILAEPYVAGGHESRHEADLSPRRARATVYVYNDSFGGLAAKTLATFGFDFEDHLNDGWIDSVLNAEFTIE